MTTTKTVCSWTKKLIFTSILCLDPSTAFSDDLSSSESKRRLRKTTSGLARVCRKGTRSLPFGVLYKPSSDVPDSRGKKPVLLFTGSSKPGGSSVSIFSRNGKLLCTFQKKVGQPGINNGADHYYSGWGRGCGKSASQLASAAGSSGIVIGWKGGACLGPINPRSRVGKI